ncbi:MAG: T9SS type A sorting domain-containing protein [Paludibacter sp.]|jgi:hypothetical protein|nr:T9SS type A sorting domain-containing protein [Paludibacter sp.]
MKSKILLIIITVMVTVNLTAEPLIIHVSPTGSSETTVNGLSWENAVSLARGRSLANYYSTLATPVENQIWMKAGTYDLTSSFQLNVQITIYGGFAGTETALSERNWVANQTILNQTGAAMVIWSNAEKDVLLDGLILQGGRPATGSNGCGAITNGTTLRNCIIRNNKCVGGSGALAITNVSGATKNVIIENCLIINNESGTSPQAISIAVPNTEIRNTTIANNYNSTTATTAAITGGVAYKVYNSIVCNNYNGTTLAKSFGNGASKELVNNAWDVAATDGTLTNNILVSSSPFVAATGFQGAANGTDKLLSSIESADFRLTSGSTCINAGNNTYATATSDLAGNNRIQNTTVDIGCYEDTPPSASFSGGNLSNTGLTDIQLANTDVTVSSGEFIIDASKKVKSLTVAPGAKLSHNSGTLTPTNGILLESDANATATLMDNYETPTVVATVQQHLSTARNWYYTPAVSTATVPNGSTCFGYDETGLNEDMSVQGASAFWKPFASGSPMTQGKGYILQTGSSTTVSHTGTTNSGDIPVTLTYNSGKGNGYNLVGNPYPSYLSWQLVNAGNSAANMPTGTMWYRTVNYNSKNAWMPNTTYNIDDVVYNGTRFYKATTAGLSASTGGPTGGGTGITDNEVAWNYEGSVYVFATVNAAGIPTPSTVSNLIPPMQAFWVKSNGGTLTFRNTMRSHNTGGTNAFKSPGKSENEGMFVRLTVTNGVGTNEAVVYVSPDASNSFDSYDAPKFLNSGSGQPEIFTVAGNEKLAINALNDLSDGTELPLGFVAERGNNFSVSATEILNTDPGLQLKLKDYQTNVEFDLTGGQAYQFSSESGTYSNRFSLVFKSKSGITAIEDPATSNVQVFVGHDNLIHIIAPENSNYVIFNQTGQKIIDNITRASRTTVRTILPGGIYFVSLSSEGKMLSSKIILQ